MQQNYLDINFNLDKSEYGPFKKQNDYARYLHVSSDHPESILKSIPKIVQNRINMLCSSKAIFENRKLEYEEALKNKVTKMYLSNMKNWIHRKNVS